MKRISTRLGILIIVVVAIVLFGGVFLWMQKSKTPAINVQSNTETADWKTYKSSLWNYEVKIPAEFKILPGQSSILGDDIDQMNFTDQDGYYYGFSAFARNADFILKDCTTKKDFYGDDMKTKEVNGNQFYAYADRRVGTGGRMSLVEGGIQSYLYTIHNGYCYIIEYTITPYSTPSVPISEAMTKFQLLEKIFSTFKFTK